MPKIFATNPESIEFTLEVTMTLKNWEEVRDNLPADWVCNQIREPISDMILQATTKFYTIPEE